MRERRQYIRQPVVWQVRLWLSTTCFLAGRASDASVHGAWVYLNWLPSGIVSLGRTYRLDLRPGTPEEFPCTAVTRRVNRYGVGLEIREAVPLIPAGDDSLEPAVAGGEAVHHY